MVESTAVSCIHPDKYNNSVDRIISKEEEREDPRRELQSIFEYSGVSTFYKNYSVSTHNPASFQSSHAKKTILHTELILLQELQGSSRADHYKASSSNCPRASKHSTWQNKAHGSLTVFQGHTTLAGFQLILPGRNRILSGRQHPRTPYSSSQAHSYRILPGEIGFFPKGLSIVCPYNTKVSVFQFIYSCS